MSQTRAIGARILACATSNVKKFNIFAIVASLVLPALARKRECILASLGSLGYSVTRMSLDMVYIIVVIIFSAIIHEVMHGVAADRLGDPTARYAGRLTLNPIPHIDIYGSLIVPIVLILLHSPFFFAWAKPVPYNPYNLKRGRFSEAIVAGAGPLSNVVIALFAAALIRLGFFPTGMADILF